MVSQNLLHKFNIMDYSQKLHNLANVTLSEIDYLKLHTLYTFELEKAREGYKEEE